jgi:hypothetical protein
MGHVHFVRLPATPPWSAVVRQLQATTPDAARVASLTATAASDRLDRLRNDPSLVYCFWLLARLASAARSPDFADALGDVGIRVGPADSAVALIARVGERTRAELERHPASGPFGEMAALATRRALLETVGTEGGSLFGSSADDLERALRKHAAPHRFAEVARRYFGDVLARTLRFYVEKELSLYVGLGWGLENTTAAEAFADDLDRFARLTAAVVEAFAGDWFYVHDRDTAGQIGREEAQGFVAEALKKIRGELDKPQA